MFALAGDTPEQAAKEAAAVMEVETAMAQASTSRTDLRKPENRYHIYTVVDFGEDCALEFNWNGYFSQASSIGKFDTLNVATPALLQGARRPAQERAPRHLEELSALACAPRPEPVNSPSPSSMKISTSSRKLLPDRLSRKPRWKQCSSMTDRALGEAVGQDWVKQNFPPAAKDSMDKLVAALEKSLGDDIKTLPWMGDDTKKAAEEKLAMIRNKIGYPEKWRDYSSAESRTAPTWSATGSCRRLRTQLQLRQAGQAGGRERVGNDAPRRSTPTTAPRSTTSTSPPAFFSRRSSTSRLTRL